jgi:hypothetical protein
MSPKDRIRHLFGSRSREWIVFVLSIALAFLVWFLVNLSQEYSGTISVPVVAQCNIEGYGPESSNTVLVSARCRTEGFRLVREYSRRERKVVKVKFNKSDLRHTGRDVYSVIGGAKNSYVDQFFGEDAKVEAFITDTLSFIFPVENHKKVPIEVPLSVSFRSQFMQSGPFRTIPDSMTVYGPQERLDAVEKVTTGRLILSDLHNSQHGLLKVNPIKGIRMSADEISYELPVSRYVELSASVPVEVMNLPAGHSLQVYPPTAQVYLRCAFPIVKDPLASFKLYVDWKDFSSSLSGRCAPRIQRLPAGVLEYHVEPEVFDCIEVH